jgi:hypothetical protein
MKRKHGTNGKKRDRRKMPVAGFRPVPFSSLTVVEEAPEDDRTIT